MPVSVWLFVFHCHHDDWCFVSFCLPYCWVWLWPDSFCALLRTVFQPCYAVLYLWQHKIVNWNWELNMCSTRSSNTNSRGRDTYQHTQSQDPSLPFSLPGPGTGIGACKRLRCELTPTAWRHSPLNLSQFRCSYVKLVVPAQSLRLTTVW